MQYRQPLCIKIRLEILEVSVGNILKSKMHLLANHKHDKSLTLLLCLYKAPHMVTFCR